MALLKLVNAGADPGERGACLLEDVSEEPRGKMTNGMDGKILRIMRSTMGTGNYCGEYTP